MFLWIQLILIQLIVLSDFDIDPKLICCFFLLSEKYFMTVSFIIPSKWVFSQTFLCDTISVIRPSGTVLSRYNIYFEREFQWNNNSISIREDDDDAAAMNQSIVTTSDYWSETKDREC